MKKSFLLLLLLPTLLFSQNAKEIAKKCMASTVSLIMEDNFKQPLTLGSGFIVENGKVVTNLHVIEDAKFGYVTISGESTKHKIEGYLAVDKINDLALLSVPTLQGSSIEINENNPEIGEKIYAIGNPKGLTGTISEVIISGIRTFENKELIQITAPISPGSSGGPVINNFGQLLGVSVGTLDAGQNLNFAIPTKYVSILTKLPNNQITQLNIKSKAKQSSTVATSKNIKEGIELINLEWENSEIYESPSYRGLKAFSIKNNLPYEVTKVTLFFILRNSENQPIDTFEMIYNQSGQYIESKENIKPFLAKYVEGDYYEFSNKRTCQLRKGEKLEIRILDFIIKE